MKKTLVVLAVVVLAGCAAPKHPAIVTQISADSVTIQGGMFTPKPAIEEKAAESCQMYKRKPKYMSTNCKDAYCVSASHLFACLP